MGSRLNFHVRLRNNMKLVHSWRSREFLQLRLKYFDSLRHGVRIVLGFLGQECSPIFGQRVARTYRALQLHSKLWSNYLPTSKSSINPRRWTLGLLLSSLCHPKFNAIEDDELIQHKSDLDYIHRLTEATVICPKCKDRLVINKKLPGIKYCHCPDSDIHELSKKSGYHWVPFVETADLLIWRQPHPQYAGLYIYKVYGYYDDISADDFLTTQLDLEYRKKWDNLVLELRIVDKDTTSLSEVVYWEMKWPRMFSNRDYCFVRRHLVDRDTNTIVIMSKAVTHPEVSEVRGTVRVSEYWSVMQIKAVKRMNERGVEFGLTYFDNPGLSLPTWLTNWAAMAGIPDFLSKVRHAARLKRDKLRPLDVNKPPNDNQKPESISNNQICSDIKKELQNIGSPLQQQKHENNNENAKSSTTTQLPSSTIATTNDHDNLSSNTCTNEIKSNVVDTTIITTLNVSNDSKSSMNERKNEIQEGTSSPACVNIVIQSSTTNNPSTTTFPTTTTTTNTTSSPTPIALSTNFSSEKSEILSQFFKENFLSQPAQPSYDS